MTDNLFAPEGGFTQTNYSAYQSIWQRMFQKKLKIKSGPGLTFDGIQFKMAQTVLVKGQTNAPNGLYIMGCDVGPGDSKATTSGLGAGEGVGWKHKEKRLLDNRLN